MSQDKKTPADNETIEVELRDPNIAAILAWLLPGAGHVYQRRFGKGVLFMVCILGTYFFGLAIGGGHVVYAQFTKNDFRWQYGCQVLVGVPALPAMAQSYLVRNGKEPFLGGLMAPPENVDPESYDQLAEWHEKLGFHFELGTLFTVIAGLLNVLAIYDAYAGPALPVPDEQRDKPPPGDREKKKKKDA